MISFGSGKSLLDYATTQDTTTKDGGSASIGPGLNAAAKARLAATAKAALDAASSAPKAAAAVQALDKQQAMLAGDLRTAMVKAGVKLTGSVDFSVSSDGKVDLKGTDTDTSAMKAFLRADTSRPSFATRIAAQAKDALKLSTHVQQNAAISQAARFGGKPSGVMSLYNSLMQQSSGSTAVFNVSATSSSLSYPGSLTAKA